MPFITFIATILLFTAASQAQTPMQPVPSVQAVPPMPSAQDTSSANRAVFADVNIFSQMPLGSIFVLWSSLDMEADIKKQITSRSFVSEPYFMQNIDREQFEQNQILNLFEEQRKVFFKLFPEDEDD